MALYKASLFYLVCVSVLHDLKNFEKKSSYTRHWIYMHMNLSNY